MMSTCCHAAPAAPHPLDPLRVEELAAAAALVRAEVPEREQLRFVSARLEEPDKASLRAYEAGGPPPPRQAFLVLLDRATGEAFEAWLQLEPPALQRMVKLAGDREPYGQPALLVEEFFECEAIVKADRGWRAALARRGLSEDEIELAQVDPFSSGYFGRAFERGARIVRAVSFYRARREDNAYAHPIEGVVAVVDLIARRVVDLLDEDPVVPIPRRRRNYDSASLGPPRTSLRPLDVVQPEGPSFTVAGQLVRWENWSFRVGFTPREGLVLHQLRFRDGERERSIVHRASITEMVVPYGDPSASHYWKSAFDAGEYGLGTLANSLQLGCDCLGHIHYFDVPVLEASGETSLLQNVICMHEEDYGVLWKHYEMRTGVFEVRRSRRLVVSFFATVGNYDYGFYWYLYQDGTIQLEAKLTGIVQTTALPAGAAYRWGGMIAEALGGPSHQHFFNARLHMDLDGAGNSVSEHEFVPRPWGTDNPYGNAFDTTSRTLERELDATRNANGETGRYWKIVNPSARNEAGGMPGYKLMVQPSPLMLAQEGSPVRARGGFATKHVWVTPFDSREKYASGDYPNVHAGGDGLPRYVQQNRALVNQDLVVWHTFGHTHFCKPEDFPVMPVEYAGFSLKPSGFFAENPAMDLAAAPNRASVRTPRR
jgi:primary-amine oxidase